MYRHLMLFSKMKLIHSTQVQQTENELTFLKKMGTMYSAVSCTLFPIFEFFFAFPVL